MANLNKVMLIGRLTRDPESRTFANGGKVVKFGFAVSNRKKNQSTGQWEDQPMFIEVDVFNRGENGKQADLAEQSLRKGHQVFLEGHLVLDQWNDKTTGDKRSKHMIVVDNFQFLERREEGAGGSSGSYQPRNRTSAPPAAPNSGPMDNGGGYDGDHGGSPGGDEGPSGNDIPF